MASKLTERDKNILDANNFEVVGNKPYEDGKWGTQGPKDFVHLQIFDANNNLIQYESFGVDRFITNVDSDKIEFFPGNHIRSLGFESGTFTVRYNFLRKLAGDEAAVLVHTVDKNDTKIGDVYTNIDNIYITEDGIVYAGTEEQYRDNPTTTEQLKVEDLKYQIHEISPSRTEVRLRAKNIRSSYINDFVDIQTPYNLVEVTELPNPNGDIDIQTQINFAGNSFETKVMNLIPGDQGFLFTNQMIGGTLIIDDVFKVEEIDVAVRSETNVIQNPSGEEVEVDDLGNIVSYGTKEGWDESLHDDSVRALNWRSGFLDFTGDYSGTEHIGYHAKWVQREGVAGGNCIKFSDSNGLFVGVDNWSNNISAFRDMEMTQIMPNLLGEGVKHNDFINIRMDIKSTVAGKGVEIGLEYPNELLEEPQPTSPPDGYFDPSNPGPTEPQPTEPPEGYSPATTAAAEAIEAQPPSSEFGIRDTYGPSVPTPLDLTEGGNTTIWGGAGAWEVAVHQPTKPSIEFNWQVNTDVVGNALDGELSIDGQWSWNASAEVWNVNPEFANSLTAPDSSTGKTGAINYHPSQEIGQGIAFYPRKTVRGENSGWQTACNIYYNDGEPDNAMSLLFKDDLIWKQKHGQTDLDKFDFVKFDDYFPATRAVDVDYQNGVRSLYDDIFQNGFIQSVDRVPNAPGFFDPVYRENEFLIFYNNGDVDSDGNPTEESNRFFYTKRYETGPIGIITRQDKKVQFVRDINGGLNDAIINNELKFEVFSKADDDNVKYYFYTGPLEGSSEEKYYSIVDGDGGGDLVDGSGFNGPIDMKEGFGDNIPENIDAILGKSHGYGRYRYIKGNQIWRSKGTTSDGVESPQSMTDNFFRCGEVGKNGAELTYGVRSPAAENFGRFGGDQGDGDRLGTEFISPFTGYTVQSNQNEWEHIVYDNGQGEYTFPDNPLQIGALSPLEAWKWNGEIWIDNSLTPPRYSRVMPDFVRSVVAPGEAGTWETLETSIEVPADWELAQTWNLKILGSGKGANGLSEGTVWVDNVFMDFTFTDQSEVIDVLKPFRAQILSVSSDGLTINLDKTFKDAALAVGVDDNDPSTGVYDLPVFPDTFKNFAVTFINLNPKDLRTYLKFENDLFLTTNFKQDLISVSEYPNSVVYKLYEPLPSNYQNFDECIIVKEMADPLEEKINIVDFIPEEEPRLVLKTPDLNNVESPIERRETRYKSQTEILTNDAVISSELRNEFLSQSLDSVEINTDYSRYENFINFSSIEKRIINFKSKLENIESYKITSASYVGVSGSSKDLNTYHNKIIETKNNLDDFERYMYFESSSYVSGSLGQFYDNAWPKTGGSGTVSSPYVLAHTTSSIANTWFSKAMTSSSIYDRENNNKLSNLIPEFIKFDESNSEYLTFTDMIGQHFDHIWEYINALSDTFDRRDKLDEGLSKDLLYNVAQSLGWQLNDGKDLIDLPRFVTGKEVTGSAFSDYSITSERDISREIWGRIVNNMPFFLKNKGTVRALKGLINIYGIPSTILRVKEYGGPDLPDNATPQFEITRKFTKALDFRGGQSVKTTWANDSSTSRKPDTIEFRFRAATGSNQILIEKQDANNQDFFIRLKDNGSSDNYGFVSFMLSGSKVGVDEGEFKEIMSSALPVYDGDFYSVMVRRTSGSANVNVSQSYELNVGKYDSSRSKIHLYSTSTMDVTQAASASFSNAWTGSGDIFIGGSGSIADVGVQFSGSIMEYRHWTEVLNTGSFKNHVRNPKAYDGNSVSSSYDNLVLRYSFDDNKNLASDSEGIRDVSSNQTTTYSGSHSGFTGNFFRSVVDEQKTHIPSIGALRRVSNKVRIENNPIKNGENLQYDRRATNSAYDTAPTDSNKVGIWFAPTDVINNDIINSVGNLNFDNFLGDPRDRLKLSYRGLNFVSNNYWKKYTAPNNFWDYIRLIKYYDQSLYPQLRKLVPARAKPDIGLLIEPNIFERPKVVKGKDPFAENKFFSSSIDVTQEILSVTGSFNNGPSITNYDAYTGKINIFSYETGSSVISSSGENLLKEASGSEIRDSFMDRSIWQRLGEGIYSNVTMSFGDTLNGVKGGQQDMISGSRFYGINQREIPHYSSSISASEFKNYSSSFLDSDLDNFSHLSSGLRNSFYIGVKNTPKTTTDGLPPVQVIVSAPTKLVTTDEGDSSLKTGDGIVSDFKEPVSKEEKEIVKKSEVGNSIFTKPPIESIKIKKKRGLKSLKVKPETDQDRKRKLKLAQIKDKQNKGELIVEADSSGKPIVETKFKGEEFDKEFLEKENLREIIKDIPKEKADKIFEGMPEDDPRDK